MWGDGECWNDITGFNLIWMNHSLIHSFNHRFHVLILDSWSLFFSLSLPLHSHTKSPSYGSPSLPNFHSKYIYCNKIYFIIIKAILKHWFAVKLNTTHFNKINNYILFKNQSVYSSHSLHMFSSTIWMPLICCAVECKGKVSSGEPVSTNKHTKKTTK